MLFEIQGKPIAWKRPGRNGDVYFDTQKACKRKMVAAVKSELGGSSPTRLPLNIEISFEMPTPKSWSQKKRNQAFFEPHSVRPDLDNLVKFILDALKGTLWEDDAQIAGITTSKIYSRIPKTKIALKIARSVLREPSDREVCR